MAPTSNREVREADATRLLNTAGRKRKEQTRWHRPAIERWERRMTQDSKTRRDETKAGENAAKVGGRERVVDH